MLVFLLKLYVKESNSATATVSQKHVNMMTEPTYVIVMCDNLPMENKYHK